MTQYTFDDSLISDLHKDAYGVRPTQTFWTLWETMTPSQKQCEWEWLCKLVEEAVAELEHVTDLDISQGWPQH